MLPLVTLTTDFGAASPYVAAMKGVILSVNPDARLLDLTHSIPPQDVRHAAYFLARAAPYFPAGTVHVVVVDPGVGSGRAALYAEAGGQRFLAPDNGCLTDVLRALGGPGQVRHLTEKRFWRDAVSATFHGRDIFAPVAGHLTRGTDPAELGPLAEEWVRLPAAAPRPAPGGWVGEVVFVDDFGNLITNLTGEHVPGAPAAVFLDERELTPLRWVRTYAEAAPGECVCLFSSGGDFEIAVVNGSAARQLAAGVGTAVRVRTAG